MLDEIESIDVNGLTVKIHYDPDPSDPREWDNLGTMVCFHGRYTLGDKHQYTDPEELQAAMYPRHMRGKPDGVMLPLYLYDHSGITMNTTGFSCRWDSGQVGYVWASAEAIRKEYGVKRITKAIRERVADVLRAEVATYDDFLTGQVYGFTVEDSNGDEMDACWGFYGLDYCREEATSSAQYHAKQAA